MHEEEKRSILVDIFGKHHFSGDEILFFCPKCEHHKKKLSVNIKKGAFKCWVCGYNSVNIYRLIKKYGSFLARQRWEELEEQVDFSDSSLDDLFKIPDEVVKEQVLGLPKEFISLANKKLPLTSLAPLRYLKKRLIGREDILKWKIGYCSTGEYAGRVIIPSFNKDGKINYFIARTYTDEWRKYKLPENVSKDIIFNELFIDWANDLVLTEGTFDAIKATNSVPLLGSSLNENSKLFQEIVKHDTAIYVALDPDAEKKALQLIKALLSYDVEMYKVDVSGYEDVGEMTKEKFIERKNEAPLMDTVSYLEYEVSRII